MPDNEKLIKEAARMIAEFAAHEGPVDAFHTAKVMIGMFEKALGEATVTPTDDEREAATTEVYGIINSHYWAATGTPGICACGYDVDAEPAGTMAEHRAQAVIDAGFRRTEVPEPPRIGCNICGEALPDGEPHICPEPGDLHQMRYDDGSWSRTLEGRPEPQGEPSDARVTAAMQAARSVYIENGWVISPVVFEADAMRAALRAAGGVEEPEWEYAYEVDGHWDDGKFVVEEYRHVGDTSPHALARRRKAGPWVPVEN